MRRGPEVLLLPYTLLSVHIWPWCVSVMVGWNCLNSYRLISLTCSDFFLNQCRIWAQGKRMDQLFNASRSFRTDHTSSSKNTGAQQRWNFTANRVPVWKPQCVALHYPHFFCLI
ncbi:hypothetical protein H4582DRAFT_1406494 [Lactarius indigo]|nr:hypothetical protein H4582DRAFT_1406494 [Lactarius indigo]